MHTHTHTHITIEAVFCARITPISYQTHIDWRPYFCVRIAPNSYQNTSVITIAIALKHAVELKKLSREEAKKKSPQKTVRGGDLKKKKELL